MNVLKTVGSIFTLVGAGVLIGSFFTARSTMEFLTIATEADGRITDIVSSRDSDGDISYFPIVTFSDRSGREISFKGSSSTSSSSVGKAVTVKYTPDNPDNARIASFIGIWGLPFFLSIFGVVFGGLGSVALVLGIRHGWIEKDHPEYTREISANISDISLDSSISVNGRHPYRIIAQLHDPATNQVREFKSKAIWYDPREFVRQETVTVKCHPTDPRKYCMDIGFLPKKV